MAIDALWVSASEAPSAVAAAPALPMAESEILAEMVDLGGTDEALLADEDFVELLLMAVRADYAAFNRYSCEADVTIAADIYALGGDRDHRISEDMLRRWESHTGRRLHVLDVRRRAFLPQRPARGRGGAGQ